MCEDFALSTRELSKLEQMERDGREREDGRRRTGVWGIPWRIIHGERLG